MKRLKGILSIALVLTMVFTITAGASDNKNANEIKAVNRVEQMEVNENKDEKVEPEVTEAEVAQVDEEDELIECSFEYEPMDYTEFISEDASEEAKAELKVLLDKAEALENELAAVWEEAYQSEAFVDPFEFEWDDEWFEDWDDNWDDEWFEFDDWDMEEYEPLTFEEFSSSFKKDISDETVQKAEVLYNKAMALEEEEKYEEAEAVWDELFELDLWPRFEGLETLTFDLFKWALKPDLTQEVLDQVEELFNQAMSLELEEKFEESDLLWDKIDDMDVWVD